jgi:hypothetical protein
LLRKVQRVAKKRLLREAVADRVQRRKEQANKRSRWHNLGYFVENKRHQSGRWQNNLHGHWEQRTAR